MERFHGLIGIALILVLAYLLSSNRKKINPRIVLWGLGLQFTFGIFMLKTEAGRHIFDWARLAANGCLNFTQEGAHFVFGNLCPPPGELPNDVIGFNMAFQCLVTIIFFSSLMAVLYHLGVMQVVVRSFAWVMRKTMGTSGAESLSVAGNIFVGQTESPILIRPFIKEMTTSELATVMTGGFATIAGSVFVLYVSFGVNAGHLLTASVMSAPAALMIAKIMFPETEESKTLGRVKVDLKSDTCNVVDAAASGASMGVKLAINVAAMLLAFVALLAMANWGLGEVGKGIEWIFGDIFPEDRLLSIEMIFGWIFMPLAWCLGVVAEDAPFMGELLGTKIAVNELFGYQKLGAAMADGELAEKTTVIATYALCGFANFSSIAIQIAGIGGIAPERRGDLARLGVKTMLGGAFASLTTAALAGVLL
jgi:concentrative nucleoside transporter, CNT family